MGKLLNFKVVTIALLMLVLLIPLSMIKGVISERSFYREQARQDIARSWTGAQKLLGPLLVVPYTEPATRTVWDENLKRYREEYYTAQGQLYLLPDELDIDTTVTTESRSRGLYAVPVYSSKMHLQGVFDNAPLIDLVIRKEGNITFGEAYLAVVLNDIRGVVAHPQLSWGEKSMRFVSGSGIEEMASGMHAPLGTPTATAVERRPFSFDLTLHGMETLQFSPVGNSTQVTLKANWPHPSFIGRYLPGERQITNTSFSSTWRLSSFSSDMPRLVAACAEGKCREFSENTFGVSLVNPVDLYQQAERAVKYAILFILLTFVAFFLFEVMKQLRLHPMHYLLVGLALSLFYLLLISLSEHLPFAWAYLAAALASTSLIGFYVSGVLGGKRRGAALSGALLLLYGMLFAILQSEDNALLMGSLLIFVVLATVMVVTRKLDWYRIGRQERAEAAAAGLEPQ